MNRATRTLSSTFGVIAGLIGIVYGYFEILQGNVATNDINIDAIGAANPLWHGGPAPAITLVSNFRITGIVAMIASLLVILWAVKFIQLRSGGFIFILLSIEQLLVGGGTAQFMLALLIGLVATRINAPLTWWRTHLSISLRRALAKMWLVSFIISALLYVLHLIIPFVIGINGAFLDSTNPNLGRIVGYAAIAPFVLAVITGLARDSLKQPDSQLAAGE